MTEEEFMSQLLDNIGYSILYSKGAVEFDIPIDTGNLRYFAFRDEPMGVEDALREYRHRVYFNMTNGTHVEGQLDGVAPYTAAVNERPSRVQGWYDEKMVPHFIETFIRALNMFGYDAKIDWGGAIF